MRDELRVDPNQEMVGLGGWKLSGLGRELGPEGLMAFRETKHIKIRVRSRSAVSDQLGS